ncbi:MAG: hypothetical protein GXO19_07855 [Epsilonproteobacteria bacterium]|nr:hypothetical protein [Campylobacterota bacterium]NPA57625.1 hypothetical protein [Campylobacterota bacterium]
MDNLRPFSRPRRALLSLLLGIVTLSFPTFGQSTPQSTEGECRELFPEHSFGEWKNVRAFAALREDGTVTTWGYKPFGGDSSLVADQLTNVKKIYSTAQAFAALKDDGTVVTWGDRENGGDSTEVADQLIHVKAIYSTGIAFAALREDGTVVTWGRKRYGGESKEVAQLLGHVKEIFSTQTAFAALKEDGSVITWGRDYYGGDSRSVSHKLTNVVRIYSTRGAFAALKRDGTVVTWGDPAQGGDSSSVAHKLTDIVEIFSTGRAFAALKRDGTVVTWGGNGLFGGDSSAVASELTNVVKIFSNTGAFAALRKDGSVITWDGTYRFFSQEGYKEYQEDLKKRLTNVVTIFSTSGAFAALKRDGTVVTWGYPMDGGDSSRIQDELYNIKTIASTTDVFAALRGDGTVLIWGAGDIAFKWLTNVKKIYSTARAFAALKNDGTVTAIHWDSWDTGSPSQFSYLNEEEATHIVNIFPNLCDKEYHLTEKLSSNTDGALCIQKITHAYNPKTGEERDFPTPCHVPEGWIQGYPPREGSAKPQKEKEIFLNSDKEALREYLLSSQYPFGESGIFLHYDFEETDPIYDWVFVTSGLVYQFHGKEATRKNIFGWKKLESKYNDDGTLSILDRGEYRPLSLHSNPWVMVRLDDWDLDGDRRFDWLLFRPPQQSPKGYTTSIFKLDGITSTGEFKYLPLSGLKVYPVGRKEYIFKPTP